MSLKGDIARLYKTKKYISDISSIIKRHGSADLALSDMEGKYAIMMCMAQIGELINKITTANMVGRLPVRNAVAFRNIIVHNYDGIIDRDASRTLKESIPELDRIIDALILEYEKYGPENS